MGCRDILAQPLNVSFHDGNLRHERKYIQYIDFWLVPSWGAFTPYTVHHSLTHTCWLFRHLHRTNICSYLQRLNDANRVVCFHRNTNIHRIICCFLFHFHFVMYYISHQKYGLGFAALGSWGGVGVHLYSRLLLFKEHKTGKVVRAYCNAHITAHIPVTSLARILLFSNN